MYKSMYTEGPIVARSGQVSYMDYATTQAIGSPTTHELIITEEGNFKHGWDVTRSAYFDGSPPIVPKAPQLVGWPEESVASTAHACSAVRARIQVPP